MWYSLTGAVCPVGQIYSGDMQPGDRAATAAEQSTAATSALPGQIDAAYAVILASGFSDGLTPVRASMNTWGAAVSLTDPSLRNSYDTQCASMVPAMNAWEGSMMATRDAAKAAGTPVSQISWPALPSGAAAFMALCNQG